MSVKNRSAGLEKGGKCQSIVCCLLCFNALGMSNVLVLTSHSWK